MISKVENLKIDSIGKYLKNVGFGLEARTRSGSFPKLQLHFEKFIKIIFGQRF